MCCSGPEVAVQHRGWCWMTGLSLDWWLLLVDEDTVNARSWLCLVGKRASWWLVLAVLAPLPLSLTPLSFSMSAAILFPSLLPLRKIILILKGEKENVFYLLIHYAKRLVQLFSYCTVSVTYPHKVC